ncbi:efflux RND transporter periplasmic adaptor subunit [uncultured Sunxiuqinia sp.]|uniref:efflux RND transporter periplasmic adaptor subunit n=1 Tax=uncultured Sunxiuqinia sp. TaxID=1573825 RepID=UPI0030D9784E|tara:strand:- start:29687 stop:30919 length:1233 start_codon:yes stop_codon:yes gene_type:complete
MNPKKTLFISLVILLAAVAVTLVIFSTEPKATSEGATRESAMLVEVSGVERGDYQPLVVATGVVIPAQEVVVSPRVSGQVVHRSEAFTPGGFVSKGQSLLMIDPADYNNRLQMRKSELLQAKADLEMEMGRQHVAMQDYQLVEEGLIGENKALVLREPQLNAAKSRVESAEAAVKQAELDLERTTIRAPFDAHILSRDVALGSQVSLGESLGRLVGMDVYWVEVTIPLAKLHWLSFPGDDGEKGSPVKIRSRTAWGADEFRSGHLYKLVGALESQTRLARVLVEVKDPLVQQPASEGLPPLMIGAFLKTEIEGKKLEDVVRLNRDYLRQNETVWVMEDGKLRIRDVEIIFRDEHYAYITGGLYEDDQVVTTNLSTVVDGAALRVEEPANASQAGGNQNQSENHDSEGGSR